jgi:hypothetical protein
MNSSKAKKAKSKAKKVKADPNLLVAAAMLAQQAQQGPLNPEIQAAQIALQTPTTNPYHMMGAMAPNVYSPGNLISGNPLPRVYNPET